MPVAVNLLNGQYEIGGLVFGTRDPRVVPNPYLVESFEIEPGTLTNGSGGNLSQASGTTGVLTSDASYPNEDGTKFGVDYTTGMVLTFSINAWRRGQMVYDDVGKFKGVWKNRDFRNKPGELTTLRICRGGRTRLVYGRPRKVKETYGTTEQGFTPIDCQFQAADECFYEDQVNYKVIGLVNAPTNASRYPTTYPRRFQTTDDNITTLNVEGEFPTFPQLKINGPITNPVIKLSNGWTIKLNMYINFYDYVLIDPRPWKRIAQVVTANGATWSAMQYLTQDSPTFRDLLLEPGIHNISFTGIDATQTATLEIGWRNAWATP